MRSNMANAHVTTVTISIRSVGWPSNRCHRITKLVNDELFLGDLSRVAVQLSIQFMINYLDTVFRNNKNTTATTHLPTEDPLGRK